MTRRTRDLVKPPTAMVERLARINALQDALRVAFTEANLFLNDMRREVTESAGVLDVAALERRIRDQVSAGIVDARARGGSFRR